MATPHRGPSRNRRQRRAARLTAQVLPTLGGLVLVAASVGVVLDGSGRGDDAGTELSPSSDIVAEAPRDEPTVSRSALRQPISDLPAVEPQVTGRLVVLKDDTELHADPSEDSAELTTFDRGDRVAITGTARDGWTEVVHEKLPRWIASSAVAERLPKPKAKPRPAPEPTLSDAPCPRAGGVEAGLQPDTVKVLRAVCARFTDVATYGGTGGGGEHATGQALDIMVTGARGDEIAAFLQEHRTELGIEYLIWKQRIWNPSTSAGWRPMEDRGSPTANHVDHVHVTTLGSAATS